MIQFLIKYSILDELSCFNLNNKIIKINNHKNIILNISEIRTEIEF